MLTFRMLPISLYLLPLHSVLCIIELYKNVIKAKIDTNFLKIPFVIISYKSRLLLGIVLTIYKYLSLTAVAHCINCNIVNYKCG